MRRAAIWLGPVLALATAVLGVTPSVRAHESRPAYLEITQRTLGLFDVSWRRPARGDRVLRMQPRFPMHCEEREGRHGRVDGGASVERWQLQCSRSDGAGLAGHSIEIVGLSQTLTDALVRVTLLDGGVYTRVLRGNAPSFVLEGEPSRARVVRDYFLLGGEHILGGFDHVLFVLALLLIVRGTWTLVKTITAFTVAHSITLAGATLGWVSVPQAPVEAVIALSIVFMATELVKQMDGASDLAIRAPWLVALSFGLLHGFGFAGALTEIGLPRGDIPLALLMFNLGVEAGQLAIVAAALLASRAILPMVHAGLPVLRRASAYGIGAISAYWFIDRIAKFW